MKSDNVKCGMQQAPHRSLFNALGFTEEEMKKPMVGIVSSYNEIVPGHMNLDKIVNAVKLGVAEAGGVPVVFPAIAVCDGIAMGHIGMKYSRACHGAELRQERTGTFDGCGKNQCADGICIRRPDVSGTCKGTEEKSFFHV